MLYLPLASNVASVLARAEAGKVAPISGVMEATAVLFVQKLSRQRDTGTSEKHERRFAEMLRIADEVEAAAPGRFAKQVVDHFDAGAFRDGLAVLEENGIALLVPDIEFDVTQLRDEQGGWNYSFAVSYAQRLNPRHRLKVDKLQTDLLLSDQQHRFVREVLSAPDESVVVQGFAGTGKTYLIDRIVQVLNPASTLLLALTDGQLRALQARIAGGEAFTARTFGQMADDLLDRDLTNNGWRLRDPSRAKLSWRPSEASVAKWLGISSVGPLTPRDVIAICVRSIRTFCRSSDLVPMDHHLPKAGPGVTAVDRAVLVEIVGRYWRELIRPSARDIQLPVRDYHRIKLLSLTGEVIDARFTHVIVDEAHELSPPMLAFLDRSPQAVIALGDQLQNLGGVSASNSSGVRRRLIERSLRAGAAMDGILNPLIQAHPAGLQAAFAGAAGHTTRLTYFDALPLPQQLTTLLVQDEWGLFGWFQRLSHQGVPFLLLPGARKEFELFVEDCIELYRYGTRPRHGMLFRYTSWSAVEQDMAGDKAFAAVASMLAKGYTPEHFAKAKAQYRWAKSPLVHLARVRDVKNMEFDRVMISPELVDALGGAASRPDQAKVLAGLYTACSRARHELILPGEMLGRVQDLVRG
ncbi:AAA family ATPase [Pseudomonas sp. EMN2]|uniref:AAA family ATPase n=1 Tax=Pseudomonas sp. EMN2 TaxID=2615212 RepID=UPI00129A8751|nr:AAA family ATPase [Pseudomonas sp. EMN2]